MAGFELDIVGQEVALKADEMFNLPLKAVLQNYSAQFSDIELWRGIRNVYVNMESQEEQGTLPEGQRRVLRMVRLLGGAVQNNKVLLDYVIGLSTFLRFKAEFNNRQVLLLAGLAGVEDDTRGTPYFYNGHQWVALDGKVTARELIRELNKRGVFNTRIPTYYEDIQKLKKKNLIRVGKAPAKTKPKLILYVNEDELARKFGMNKRTLGIMARGLIEVGLKESSELTGKLISSLMAAYGKGHVSFPKKEAEAFLQTLS